MLLEAIAPTEFQGAIISQLNQRHGLIQNSTLSDDGSVTTVRALVPLANMFGYATDVRSVTQGKAEFTMEYDSHAPVPKERQAALVKEYQLAQQGGDK